MIVALINVLFLSLQYRDTQSSSLHQKSKTAWNSSRTHPVVVERNSISLGSSPTKFICCTRQIWSQSWLDDPRDLSAHQGLTLKSWRRPWKVRWSGYVDEAVIGSASLTISNNLNIWQICLNIDSFVLFFCLFLYRVAVKIGLPFHILYKLLLYWSRNTTGRSGTTHQFVPVVGFADILYFCVF